MATSDSIDKQALRQIWRVTTGVSVVTGLILIPVFFSVGAEPVAAIILAVVCAVVFWQAAILVAVSVLVPELTEHVDSARVERVMDDIDVESATRQTGDAKLDEYIKDYARARDFWGKSGLLVLAFVLVGLFYYVFGIS